MLRVSHLKLARFAHSSTIMLDSRLRFIFSRSFKVHAVCSTNFVVRSQSEQRTDDFKCFEPNVYAAIGASQNRRYLSDKKVAFLLSHHLDTPGVLHL